MTAPKNIDHIRTLGPTVLKLSMEIGHGKYISHVGQNVIMTRVMVTVTF